MKKAFFTGSAIVTAGLPFLALATSTPGLYNFQDKVIAPLSSAINALVPILMSLALVVFIWGLVKYIWAAGDPKAASEGKSIMIYGIIALFVMASVWGLTNALGGALGLSSGGAPQSSDLIPQ